MQYWEVRSDHETITLS